MLPEDLNRLLIIVVVLSMALTPALAELGKRFAERTDSMPLPGGGGTGAAPSQPRVKCSPECNTCWCQHHPVQMRAKQEQWMHC